MVVVVVVVVVAVVVVAVVVVVVLLLHYGCILLRVVYFEIYAQALQVDQARGGSVAKKQTNI